LQVGAGCTGGPKNNLVTWTYVNGATTSIVAHTETSTVAPFRTLLIGTGFHHLAVTFNGMATLIYIDGISRSVTNGAGNLNNGVWGGFTTPTSGPTSATLGARQTSGGLTSFFQGSMDEVTLYDHALSPAEISNLYNAQSGGKCKAPACTAGTNAAAGSSCGPNGLVCDGNGVCH
jgi:hypothetical protein